MKKIRLFVLLLCFVPVSSHAGFFTDFIVNVAANEFTKPGSHSSVSPSDEKKINAYLWKMVKKKNYKEGYEFFAEVLEKSNDIAYIDTAAQAYFDNGLTNKALDLYERKVLPTARAFGTGYEKTYRRMAKLSSDKAYKIPYAEIYKKIQSSKKNNNATLTKVELDSFVEYAVWGIFLIMLFNLAVNIIGLPKIKKKMGLNTH